MPVPRSTSPGAARVPASPSPRRRADAARALGVALAIVGSGPAIAAIGASASLTNDARMRGYSLSGGRPVASLDLSYDDTSGVYAAASASGVATVHDGVQPLGLQGTIGYARQLKFAVLDVGVVNSGYTRYWSGGRSTYYVEGYVGVATKSWSSHLFYSPNYYRTGGATLYGEIDGVIRLRTT